MANKLMVHEQEAIRNLTALGWGIRRIARDLKVRHIWTHGGRTQLSQVSAERLPSFLRTSTSPSSLTRP